MGADERIVRAMRMAEEGIVAHILVIDDDDVCRALVAAILTKHGHRVTSAKYGHTGVKLAGEEKPDFVVTDIFMPEQDGFETIAKLKALSPSLPVVAMTGFRHNCMADQPDYLKLAELFGADLTLAKPVVASLLVDAVNRLLPADRR